MSQSTKMQRMLTDLEYYARQNLMIKPKIGAFQTFKFKRAQKYLHDRIEDQKRRTGKVRMIIPKARQLGASTYVSARFYWLTVTNPAIMTFIFAHDSDASESLFNMPKNYYEMSAESFRPVLGKSNAKELLFPHLKSGYRVGTAGTKGLGRSKTHQLLHWSEVAYSPNPDDHAQGILQTIPDAKGTEIILESTANGQGDYFHRMYQQAMGHRSDWEVVFLPWYWDDDYKRTVTDDFELSSIPDLTGFPSEQEYYDLYHKDGMHLEHLAWRRHKINTDFQGDPLLFMREYPTYAEEAFIVSSEDSYIQPILVQKARNTKRMTTSAPIVFGVDPARLGGDLFRVCIRAGRNVTGMKTIKAGRIDETAKELVYLINKHKPKKVFIDAGGLGVGVYDILVGWGYGQQAVKVDFGGASRHPDKNRNKRAEMYRSAKEWLLDEPVSIDLTPKLGDQLQIELSLAKAEWKQNSQLLILPKENIKKELGYSPDSADAFILTFAEPVNPEFKHPDNRRNQHQANVGFNVF